MEESFPSSRLLAVLCVLGTLWVAPGVVLAERVTAQGDGVALDGADPVGTSAGDPEEVARAYLSAVEGMAWRAVVDRVHPETAESFRRYLEIMLFQGVDATELIGREAEAATASGLPLAEALEAVSGVGSVAAYLELDDHEVLLGAFRGLQRDSPGMINAWVDRETEVLGVVAEGDTLRHVVYRLEWGISGATADVEILTLAPGPHGGWLVRTARELESLRPAISGIFRRAPAGGGATLGVGAGGLTRQRSG